LQSGGCPHLLFYRAADLHEIEWLFQNIFMLEYLQTTFKLFSAYFKAVMIIILVSGLTRSIDFASSKLDIYSILISAMTSR
jgi:hypothetical protein